MKRKIFLVSGTDALSALWVEEAAEWLATATQGEVHNGPGNVFAARMGKTIQIIPDRRNTIGGDLVQAGFDVVKIRLSEQKRPWNRQLTNWGGQSFCVNPPQTENPVSFYRALEEVLTHALG